MLGRKKLFCGNSTTEVMEATRFCAGGLCWGSSLVESAPTEAVSNTRRHVCCTLRFLSLAARLVILIKRARGCKGADLAKLECQPYPVDSAWEGPGNLHRTHSYSSSCTTENREQVDLWAQPRTRPHFVSPTSKQSPAKSLASSREAAACV